jgi:hypothetical protein
MDVFEVKRGVVAGGVSKLSCSQQVIVPGRTIGLHHDVYDHDHDDGDGDGDGIDSFGQVILSLVLSDLALDPKIDIAVEVFSYIHGPHPDERLANRT